MATFWGPATESKDLGVVAELCPHCDKIARCRVTTTTRSFRVFFVPVTPAGRETSALCTGCGGLFPCTPWRYPALVPAQQASALPLDEVLAQTNPGLAERVELKQQVKALGGDPRFTVALEQLEGMRWGGLHAELLQQLLDWARLDEAQRERLVQQVGGWFRAWKFAQQIAPTFPTQAGCLPAALAAAGIWSAFLWAPVVRDWLWGTVTAVAGLAVAALVAHLLITRQVGRWARQVLVPEAQRANVPLTDFLAVVDDLPGSRLGVMEDLWPIKDQLDTIRRGLRPSLPTPKAKKE